LPGALSAYAGLLKRLPNSESTNHLTSEQDFVSVLGFHG